MKTQTTNTNTKTTMPVEFEQKLYRTLKNIDAGVIPEYMESFGLAPEKASTGLKLKEFADKMSEGEFITAMKNGLLPKERLSPAEIEVLYSASNEFGDEECDPPTD